MVSIADKGEAKPSLEQAHAFREQARILALQIGLRPAARAIGISEDRIRQWSKRYKWDIASIRPSATCSDLSSQSPNVTSPINVLASILAQEGDRTRSAMARTARRAFEHADTLPDDRLHELPRSVAMEKHAKVAQIAHGWNQSQSTVAVQVNVPLPSTEEREEMRSIDAKLDAIAAKLKG